MEDTQNKSLGGGWLTKSMDYEEAAPLVMSMLCAVVFISVGLDYFSYSHWTEWTFTISMILAAIAVVRSFEKGVDAWLTLVPSLVITYMFIAWPLSANHHWFFLWAAFPVLMRPDLLTSHEFSRYVSVSMGIMMIAAGFQKLIGGGFLDGSFFASFAVHGSITEQYVNLFCGGSITSENMTPCGTLVWLSRFVLVWQFVIGFFLLFHVRNATVFFLEITFLLGVGTIADEWVFQAINLCCMIFVMRYRVPLWFFVFILPFTLLGKISLAQIVPFLGGPFS
jgi:hypothetical protein